MRYRSIDRDTYMGSCRLGGNKYEKKKKTNNSVEARLKEKFKKIKKSIYDSLYTKKINKQKMMRDRREKICHEDAMPSLSLQLKRF